MKDCYKITILPSAEKKLLKLSKPLRIKIVDRISALTNDPRPPGVKNLKEDQPTELGLEVIE